VIEAAWSAVTSSVSRRDPAAAGGAVPAAVREGLLQTAGPAAFVALQSSPSMGEVEALLGALRERGWPGDDVLIELLTAAATGADTGRGRLVVDLDMLGNVLGYERGGYLDLTTGTVWPIELVEDDRLRASPLTRTRTRSCGWRCPARAAATPTATWPTSPPS
jgi:hypothetical protein